MRNDVGIASVFLNIFKYLKRVMGCTDRIAAYIYLQIASDHSTLLSNHTCAALLITSKARQSIFT